MVASFEDKSRLKVERTLVRLKYALMADRMLYDLDEQRKAARLNGEELRLETTLQDILNETS